MNISKVLLLLFVLAAVGCSRQSVVAPSAATTTPAPVNDAAVSPAASIAKTTSPELVTQTQAPAVEEAHAVGDVLPSMISMGVVEYPEEARLAEIGGKVVLIAYVGKDGVPTRCVVESQRFEQNELDKEGNTVSAHDIYSIQRKDGSVVPLADLFDSPAIKAVMEARFNPGRHAGVAVLSAVRLPVNFGVKK